MRLSASPDPGFLITGDGAARSVRRRTVPRIPPWLLAGGAAVSIGIGVGAIGARSDHAHTPPRVTPLNLARLSPLVEVRLSSTPKSASPRRPSTRHARRNRTERPALAVSPNLPASPAPVPVPASEPAPAASTADGPGEFF